MNAWAVAALCVSAWAGSSVYAGRWLYRNRDQYLIGLWVEEKGACLAAGTIWPAWMLAWGMFTAWRLLVKALMGDLDE